MPGELYHQLSDQKMRHMSVNSDVRNIPLTINEDMQAFVECEMK